MPVASIISSVITSQVTQRDGRISVDEKHIDNNGAVWYRSYLSHPQADLNANLVNYAASLAEQLNAGEISANISQVITYGSLAIIRLDYSNQDQGLAALREAYHNSTHLEAVMIGDFLASLSDANLRNIFDLTQAQVTALRANRLTPAANIAAAIRAASGE